MMRSIERKSAETTITAVPRLQTFFNAEIGAIKAHIYDIVKAFNE